MKKVKHPQLGKSLLLIAVVTLVVFDLLFGCWGTVYAAQDSLPGDLLYTVKLTREDLQLAFTSNTQARIKLLTTFTDHRVDEAETLALQGQSVPDELAILMDGYLEELIVLTSSMDEATQEEVLEGVQRHLRPRDQDQGMTDPKDNSVDPPPQDMNKNGKGQDSADIAVEILSINRISEISTTLTITPGNYGPGPCSMPECTNPLADEHSPGAYLGVPPGPGNHEGYGSGFDPGHGAQQSGNSNSDGQGQGGQP